MPKIEYEQRKFSPATLEIIERANMIIKEYERQGFSLTLRQLYYQFVARALLANTERNYKRLGSIISDGRRAGLIDWLSIIDRTRFLRAIGHAESPQEVLEQAADGYAIDLWGPQPARVEVWIEKDALVGVISGVCDSEDVPYFACRGYVSDSEIWRAAVRVIQRDRNHNQSTIILHLGDHDPSGIDMTRDIQDRLELFSFRSVEVRRLALNMNQIEEQSPPPNPAKITDSRYDRYVERYGTESWELDALDPRYISDLILEAILEIRDPDLWEQEKERQEDERSILRDLIDQLPSL